MMKKNRRRSLQNKFTLLWGALFMFSAEAKTLKLATIAPDRSPWVNLLRETSQEISKETGGSISVKIYPGGIAGDERSALRKMKIGQVDIAVLSPLAIKTIVPETLILSMPFFIKNEAEVKIALEKITPIFDKEFDQKGYRVIAWSQSGWVHLFTNKKLIKIGNSSKFSLGVAPNEPEMTATWQSIGFNVATINVLDTLTGLQSGLIDGFYTTPTAAAAYQWFAAAPNMLNIPIAPFFGAIIMSKRAWNKIDPDEQAVFQKAFANIAQEFLKSGTDSDSNALRIMQENKLAIVEPDSADQAEWIRIFRDRGYKGLIGPNKSISQETYNLAVSYLKK